ncbi:SDR family NAD(P)-dependent oxidoreductase (plasmid) [Acinetobacter indicus]|nr:SDR family NAD(P)-dependent oxidoreductase [Acinetobacter indicus]
MGKTTVPSSINKTFLIHGISYGLGKALATLVPNDDDLIYGISRSTPQLPRQIEWIQTDLAYPVQACKKIKDVIGDKALDVFIYNVGVWEQDAFTHDYDFSSISALEIQTIINTNITSCILSIQSILENLKKSDHAKVILIGSTWGLDNHNGKEIVFSATKFALRGISHALRELIRKDRIGVTVLNLGYLASDFDLHTTTESVLKETDESLIPMSDVVAAVQFVLNTSRASCVKEIIMPAMQDTNI